MASNAFTPPHFTRPFRRRRAREAEAERRRPLVCVFACLLYKTQWAINDKKQVHVESH